MTSDNKELLEIQAELQTLVMREAEAGKDEKKILVVRKRDLVSKIGLLERAVQEERVQKIKGLSQ